MHLLSLKIQGGVVSSCLKSQKSIARDAEDAVYARDGYDYDGYRLRVEFPKGGGGSFRGARGVPGRGGRGPPARRSVFAREESQTFNSKEHLY